MSNKPVNPMPPKLPSGPPPGTPVWKPDYSKFTAPPLPHRPKDK